MSDKRIDLPTSYPSPSRVRSRGWPLRTSTRPPSSRRRNPIPISVPSRSTPTPRTWKRTGGPTRKHSPSPGTSSAQQPNPLSTGGYLAIIPCSSGTEKIQTAIARTINSVPLFPGSWRTRSSTAPTSHNLAVAVQALDKIAFYALRHGRRLRPGRHAGPAADQRGNPHPRAVLLQRLEALALLPRPTRAGHPTDFAGVNTTQTMNLQTLANITPDEAVDETASRLRTPPASTSMRAPAGRRAC